MELGPISLDRMVQAVENVRERLLRSSAALQQAGVPFALVGGNAVMSWVASQNEGGERNTPNVELLLRRNDFVAAKNALESVRFIHRPQPTCEAFIDGPDGAIRSAVVINFANEKIIAADPMTYPDVTNPIVLEGLPVLALEPLVLVFLTRFRTLERVYLRDLIDIGLIDKTWIAKLCPMHAARLQELLDTPEG